MNPCTTSHIPKEWKEMEINDNNKETKSRVKTDASESTNDANNDNDKWINTWQIFRYVCKNEQNLNNEKVKSNNENRYKLSSDFEKLYYSNENKIEKT